MKRLFTVIISMNILLVMTFPHVLFAAPQTPGQIPPVQITNDTTAPDNEVMVQQLRSRVDQAIVMMLAKLTQRENTIHQHAKLRPTLQQELLSDTAETRSFLVAQQQALHNTSTLEGVRGIAQKIREFMQQQKDQLVQRQTELNEKNIAIINRVQEAATALFRILNRAVAQLERSGQDTTELKTLMTQLQTDIDALSKEDVHNDPVKLQSTLRTIHSELSTVIQKINTALTAEDE
ncbi:MAG: hypothetical protein HYV32_01430 [Candidatus Kerfeldbacteria bacterium]|nr:hypothetical protein [Candidatus Kerfeldbacteria bacterium]